MESYTICFDQPRPVYLLPDTFLYRSAFPCTQSEGKSIKIDWKSHGKYFAFFWFQIMIFKNSSWNWSEWGKILYLTWKLHNQLSERDANGCFDLLIKKVSFAQVTNGRLGLCMFTFCPVLVQLKSSCVCVRMSMFFPSKFRSPSTLKSSPKAIFSLYTHC